MTSEERYAKVAWSVGDVLCLDIAEQMDEWDARAFLLNNASHIQDAMVRAGWDAIQTLLEMEDEEKTTNASIGS